MGQVNLRKRAAGVKPKPKKKFGQQTPRRWGWGTPLKKRTATRTLQIVGRAPVLSTGYPTNPSRRAEFDPRMLPFGCIGWRAFWRCKWAGGSLHWLLPRVHPAPAKPWANTKSNSRSSRDRSICSSTSSGRRRWTFTRSTSPASPPSSSNISNDADAGSRDGG